MNFLRENFSFDGLFDSYRVKQKCVKIGHVVKSWQSFVFSVHTDQQLNQPCGI